MFWDISDWYALSLQISVGNSSSPSPEVKWPAEYENVSIDVEDSIILIHVQEQNRKLQNHEIALTSDRNKQWCCLKHWSCSIQY